MTFVIALPNDEMSCIIINANKDVYLHESQTTRCLGVKGPAEGRSGPEALDGVRRCDVALSKDSRPRFASRRSAATAAESIERRRCQIHGVHAGYLAGESLG
jgi:hypothetical protein